MGLLLWSFSLIVWAASEVLIKYKGDLVTSICTLRLLFISLFSFSTWKWCILNPTSLFLRILCYKLMLALYLNLSWSIWNIYSCPPVFVHYLTILLILYCNLGASTFEKYFVVEKGLKASMNDPCAWNIVFVQCVLVVCRSNLVLCLSNRNVTITKTCFTIMVSLKTSSRPS